MKNAYTFIQLKLISFDAIAHLSRRKALPETFDLSERFNSGYPKSSVFPDTREKGTTTRPRKSSRVSRFSSKSSTTRASTSPSTWR